MKRIYISILVTALISLFLLSKFIDALFDAQFNDQPDSQPPVMALDEFAAERKFLKGIARQLALTDEETLVTRLAEIGRLYEVELFLENKKELSLSTDLEAELNANGLLLDSESGIQLMYAVPSHPGRLLGFQLDSPLEQLTTDTTQLELWLTLLFYASFCLVLLIWAFPLGKRLSNLNRLASEFGRGDLSKRVELSRFSYIEQLERSFNRMASQIEELIAENKLLAGSISHDLRTPLSCLRFGVDAAVETGDPDKKDHYLSRMEQDLSRMESMLEAFLDYASLERKRFELMTTQIGVRQLLDVNVKGCRPLAEKKAIGLELKPMKDLSINADSVWMNRAISNLLTNAINHAEYRISISCESKGSNLVIRIEDDGPGIPEPEQHNIFKAFVKLDKSRSKTSHYGLGLAIVARVVSWHNGSIEVCQSKRLGGAEFRVLLPF